MQHIPTFSHRKIFLTALALLVVSTLVLVAQNTPPKEAAPAETGQVSTDANVQDFQTYHGEEYLIYIQGGTTMQYDPATRESMPLPTNFAFGDARLYKGNLGEFNHTDHFGQKDGVTTNFFTEKYVTSNGNAITTTLAQGSIVSVPGLKDFTLTPELVKNSDDIMVKKPRNPVAWIDRTHLLISKGDIDWQFFGISVVDIANGKEEDILKPYTYGYPLNGSIAAVSPSGRYLAVNLIDPKCWSDEEGGRPDGCPENSNVPMLLYDFKEKKFIPLARHGSYVTGWTTTKEISQGPGEPGFFSPTTTGCYNGQNDCFLSSSVSYRLPFKCGEVYRVNQDGGCNFPSSCGGPGGVWSSWTNFTGHHTVKYPANSGNYYYIHALDFTDNGVGGATANYSADNLPIVASASGTVIIADWQNGTACVQGAGAGLHVQIQHPDGTYTMYGHLSQKSVSVGQSVLQGQQIGLEGYSGHTDPCGFEHLHFEHRTNPGQWQTGFWTHFDDLPSGTLPTDNYLYISKYGPCSGDCCSMPCVNGGTLPACGGIFTGSTSGSDTRATYFVTTSSGGNLATVNLSGPEKMYQITPSITGIMYVKLTNSSNLNAVILTGTTCSNLNTLLNCTGTAGTSSNSYTASCNVTAGNTYYIVVDGIGGASGSYTLTVTTPCIPNLTDNGSTKSNSGRNVTLSIKVANNGMGNAGSFVTRIWLSTDTYLENGNDYYIAYVDYSNGLAAGYSSSATGTIVIPSNVPAGYYYVLEKIDYVSGNWNGAVAESNENDNAYYLAPGTTFYLPPAFSGGGADDRSDLMPVQLDGSNYVQEEQTNTTAVLLPMVQPTTSCIATVNGYNISTSQVEEGSSFVLANSLGQIIGTGKATGGVISCDVRNSGIYFLTIIDGTGNKCSQKIFVK